MVAEADRTDQRIDADPGVGLRGDTVQLHPRASVLNRLFAHDAYHAGEISQIIGVAGLPAADPWRRSAP